MNNVEVVIARYKEDISWIKLLNPLLPYRTRVYNKFEGENLLPNVGREAHTYLTHIVENYDNLADYTVFLQGDPIYHCRDLLKTIDLTHTLEFDFLCMSDGFITCDVNGRPGCGGGGKIHTPVGKHYEWVTGKKSPQVFESPSSAQFAVSRKVITDNPRSLYERCLLSVKHENNPIEAHCLERSWASIFGFVSSKKCQDLHYRLDNELDFESYVREHYAEGEMKLAGSLGAYSIDESKT